MSELLSRTRALSNLPVSNPSANELVRVDTLLGAASQAIESYCGRAFTVERRDETYPGTGRSELLLRHYPVIQIERIAFAPEAVLRIRNTSSANQRAAGAISDTALSLTRVASGVTREDRLAFADHPTLLALCDAVNAVGNGWSASLVRAGDGLRASADLRCLQGAFFAKDVDAELRLHVEELSSFEVDASLGCVMLPRSGFVEDAGSAWNGGPRYWRVIYTAGFERIPDDVQEACAQLVAQMYWQATRDPGLAHETIPGAFNRVPLTQWPATVTRLLQPYRTRRL